MSESYDGIRVLADLFASLKYPTATMTRSIYPITQNILQEDIGNHSLILLQTTEYYKRELEMNP